MGAVHAVDASSKLADSLVFEEPVLAAELARWIVENDLRYSRPVTPQDAAAFADPEETVYRFRMSIGHLFEEEL